MSTLGAFLIQILVSVVLIVAAMLLMPKAKSTAEDPADFEGPSASDSKPIPVVFGTVKIKAPNCLWFGDIGTITKKVKA